MFVYYFMIFIMFNLFGLFIWSRIHKKRKQNKKKFKKCWISVWCFLCFCFYFVFVTTHHLFQLECHISYTLNVSLVSCCRKSFSIPFVYIRLLLELTWTYTTLYNIVLFSFSFRFFFCLCKVMHIIIMCKMCVCVCVMCIRLDPNHIICSTHKCLTTKKFPHGNLRISSRTSFDFIFIYSLYIVKLQIHLRHHNSIVLWKWTVLLIEILMLRKDSEEEKKNIGAHSLG